MVSGIPSCRFPHILIKVSIVFVRYKNDGKGRSVPVAKIYTQKEHPITNSQIDKDALWAIRKIQQSGGEAYIVGGAIRDMMLGRKPKDFDIATSLSPRQVQRLFWNARIIGRRFRIVHLFFSGKIIEVTTFRSDEENFEDGKNNLYGTIEQDARRRDFSINSLYYNPSNGQLLDFNDAMADFRRKVIRSLIPLSYTFSEDPVRMIRAIKYQATTGFELKRDVRKAIKKNAERIETCSTSRLTEEVAKILASGYSYEILTNLRKYGLLQFILPCWAMYSSLDAVRISLQDLDKRVQDSKKEGEPVAKEVHLYALIAPLLAFENASEMSPEELFHEAFRQAKILISPMTPPNYELEKAADMVLQDMGVKRAKTRRSAEARAPKKKPNTLGRKSAANEELSVVPAKKRRKRKKKNMKGERIQIPEAPKTLAEEHDL